MKKKEVTVYAKSLKKAVNDLKDTLNADNYSKEPEYEEWTGLQLKSIRITRSELAVHKPLREDQDSFLQFTFDVEY